VNFFNFLKHFFQRFKKKINYFLKEIDCGMLQLEEKKIIEFYFININLEKSLYWMKLPM